MVLAAAAAPAFAQYPDRPVRVLVPFSAGGTGDAVHRLLAQKLSERIGRPFVIENKLGAGGRISYDTAAKSKPDGYTLAGVDPGYAVIGALYPNLPWDHDNDLVPVAMYARTPYTIVVGGNSRFKTLREVIEFARANPGKVTVATPGVGSGGHFTYETLRRTAKVEMTHVPFKGGGEALASVMANTVDVLVTAPPTILGHMKTGTVRVLGNTSERRWTGMESVPTMIEQGVNFSSYIWFGLLAPKGTPQPVVDFLHQNVVALLKDPKVREALQAQTIEGNEMGPAELGRTIREETKLFSDIVRAANIKVE